MNETRTYVGRDLFGNHVVHVVRRGEHFDYLFSTYRAARDYERSAA